MFSDNKEEGKKEPELKDIMVEEFPWYLLTDENRGIFEKRVRIEVTPLHDLYSIKNELAAVAKCEMNDDVLFACGEDYYVVHLTWGNGNASYPWYVKIEKDKIVEYLLENYESD